MTSRTQSHRIEGHRHDILVILLLVALLQFRQSCECDRTHSLIVFWSVLFRAFAIFIIYDFGTFTSRIITAAANERCATNHPNNNRIATSSSSFTSFVVNVVIYIPNLMDAFRGCIRRSVTSSSVDCVRAKRLSPARSFLDLTRSLDTVDHSATISLMANKCSAISNRIFSSSPSLRSVSTSQLTRARAFTCCQFAIASFVRLFCVFFVFAFVRRR